MAAANAERSPDMLRQALEYLSLGFPVFAVCSPAMGYHEHWNREKKRNVECPPEKRGKNPMEPWGAFQKRLPTRAEVTAAWGKYPDANIGMATGALSKVVVLDCDSGAARQLAMEKGGLDKTPAVFTGKPGGVHYWLAHPGEAVHNFAAGGVGRQYPGLDFRGDGGYCLLPPSLHALGARYRWAEQTIGSKRSAVPEWLHEILKRGGASSSDGRSDRESLDYETILAGVDQGSRDDFMFSAAGRFRRDDLPIAAAEALIRQAARACRPAFDESEAVSKVQRAYETYPAGEASPTVIVDEFFSPPQSASNDPMADTEAEAAQQTGFTRPISELLALPDTDPDWMVDQLFTVASNGWVAAEPKVGKSWIVLELAYALSTGMPFLGRFAVKQPRRLLYVQEEDSVDRVKRRLKKLIRGDASRVPPPDEYFRYSIRKGFKVDNLVWLETLRQEIIKYDAEVIILDVFNRLHGSDENKQVEMTAILNNLTRLTNDYGCAFIIVHHNRKPQQGNEARGNQRIRGSGVLGGWGECSLYLTRSKEKDAIIVTPESKDAPEMDDFTITLTDQDNGGIVLEMGNVEPVKAALSKADEEALEAVQRITDRGIGATAMEVGKLLGKDRSTVHRRLTRLAEAGFLTATPISSTNNPTIIYTVVSQ